MEITIMTSFSAKGNMKIDTCHRSECKNKSITADPRKHHLYDTICRFVPMRMRVFLLVVVCVIGIPAILGAQSSARTTDTLRKSKSVMRESVIQINRNQLSATIDSLDKDSGGGNFTIQLKKDSLGLWAGGGVTDSNKYKKLLDNPLLPLSAIPRDGYIAFRETNNKDFLFYLITGILLLLSLIRIGFPTYFNRLFQYFFQTSVRQRQTRDRLFQEQIAAVGLNLLFFIVMGTLITLLAIWKGWFIGNFWILWTASTGLLCIIYAGKYIFLQMVGWILNNRDAMRSYIFIVYLVNKTAAILILPLLVVSAFSTPALVESSFQIALVLVIAAFVYRYAVSFSLIRNKMALNAFHFFLYFISLEVIPLLVILKLLFRKLNVFV